MLLRNTFLSKTAYNKTGETLVVTRVTRVHSGPYLCIASNGVPPSVSRRIILHVHFPPSIWIPNQTLTANLHHEVSLDCHVEAYPPASVFWLNSRNEPITEHSNFPENKLKIQHKEKQYKTHLRLTIRNLNHHDFGLYKCLARNTLGEQQAVVHLQESNNYQSNESHNELPIIEELSNDLKVQNSLQLPENSINSIKQNAQQSKKSNDKIYPVYVKIRPKKSASNYLQFNHFLFFLIINFTLFNCLIAFKRGL